MKYRDHRGSLVDSIATQQEFNSLNDLKKYLEKEYADLICSLEEIKFKYLGTDERVDWDTWMVLIKIKNIDEYVIVGFADFT